MEPRPRYDALPQCDDDKTCPAPKVRGCSHRTKVYVVVLVSLLLALSVDLLHWHSDAQQTARRDRYLHIHPGPVGQVMWWPCDGPDVLSGAECGYITVPLDYTNASAGVAQIALARYRATQAPRKGSVLLNPGGPGIGGTALASRGGAGLQSLIGMHYDMVGFDPRGVGDTLPKTQCFAPGAYTAFKAHTVLQRGYDVGPAPARELLLRARREADALLQTQYAVCHESMGEQLRYMGTSTVVRDMDFITKALDGEDALINYWGVSYGSVLGMYLVNMLPDRVGRVLIDGIVDAGLWADTPSYKWYRQWLQSTEETYNVFVQECSNAGPESCALAREVHEDPFAIQDRIEAFMTALNTNPLAVGGAALNPGILTEGIARSYLFSQLQQPAAWPSAAHALAAAMDGNGAPLLDAGYNPTVDVGDLERAAVSCTDNARHAPPAPEAVVDEWLDVHAHVSRFAFDVVPTEPDGGCQFWPASATPPERFHGPWNATLRTPVLIVSARTDPVTPLASAQRAQALLGDSARLVVQNSLGHCAITVPSLCTAEVTRRYFEDGTLPPPGTTCKPDVAPFPLPDAPRFSEQDVKVLKGIEEVGWLVASLRRPFGFMST